MTLLFAIMLGTMAAAALTAVLVALRRAEHVPAAVALVLLAALNFVDSAILRALPAPGEEIPRSLWPLMYFESAAQLGTIAVVPGLSVAVSVPPERRRVAVGAVAAAWLLASVVLAALYPSPLVRGASLQQLYLAADLIGLFVSIVAIARWARWARGRASPGSAHLVAFAFVALDAGILLFPYSPWRGYVFAGRFDLVQVLIIVVFAALAAFQGVLWRFSTR